jgi:hypothetical protein
MIADLQQNAPEAPPKRIARHRITIQDAKAIGKMVARGLTETEAVLKYDCFTVKQWFNWKSRGKRMEKYAEVLTRIKADRIDANLEEIERAATGADGVRHDWRAADRLNAIIAPERFAQNREQTVHNHQTAIIAAVGSEEQLAKLVAMYAGQATEQQKVVEIESVKQIGDGNKAD